MLRSALRPVFGACCSPTLLFLWWRKKLTTWSQVLLVMRSGWKIANLSLQTSAGSGGGSGNDFTYVGQGLMVGLFVDFFLEILVLAVCVPEHNTSTLRAG